MIGLGFPAAFDEGTVALDTADKLLVYTDGLIQYQAAGGGMFSQGRLEACALDRRGLPPERMVEALIAAMLEFGGNALPMDDVSLLCLETARPGGTETRRS
jgi:serine phosphatase RsbU (regulator of sigma subunit)